VSLKITFVVMNDEMCHEVPLQQQSFLLLSGTCTLL